MYGYLTEWVLCRNPASVTRVDADTRGIAAVIPIGAHRVPNEIAAGRRTLRVANDDRFPHRTEHLLHTPVRHGLLGDFAIDHNGDTRLNTIGIYRIADDGLRFETAITADPRLVAAG